MWQRPQTPVSGVETKEGALPPKNAPRLGFCQPLAADDLAAAPGTDQAGRPNKVQKMRMHNLFAEN